MNNSHPYFFEIVIETLTFDEDVIFIFDCNIGCIYDQILVIIYSLPFLSKLKQFELSLTFDIEILKQLFLLMFTYFRNSNYIFFMFVIKFVTLNKLIEWELHVSSFQLTNEYTIQRFAKELTL